MSEERGFFARIFGRQDDVADEGETRLYSLGELVAEREEEPEDPQPQGFTIERAAEIIDGLPPDVPPESALSIVRGTLAATGIEAEDLDKSTHARETNLTAEIKFSQSRQEDLRQRTEEVVRSMGEQIRKAREARDTGIAEEADNISRATTNLEEVRRVRAFFGFSEVAEVTADEPGGDATGDETRVFEPYDDDDDEDTTRVIRRPGSPGDDDSAAHDPYGTTGER